MNDTYSAPALFFSRHVETIYPALLRQVEFIEPSQTRLNTPDDDFLDLDWYKHPVSSRCVVISHGLEGNSRRAYVRGMAKAFYQAGYDVLAWNYRGCGIQMNRQLRFYHSGATDDLALVVSHAAEKYDKVSLVGFSLGGNLTVKYMGEGDVPSSVTRAVAISAPLDLYQSSLVIARPSNWVYTQRFLRSLSKKVKAKAELRNDLDSSHLSRIRTLMEFDDIYTGPMHGYKDARDYYEQCSGIHFIERINKPTLILSALNDPFLSATCFPEKQFRDHPYVSFLFPQRGGHVGFASFGQNGLYWSEMKALAFIHA